MSFPALDISHLTISLQGRPIIQDAGLSLERGEAAVLSGSNGCGKTTLLRCIAGLILSYRGNIRILGMDSRESAWKKNRHNLAYVSQEQQSRKFPLTVREMAASGMAGISVSTADGESRIRRALDASGCSELTDRYYFSLSGGERQRVALARCLAQGAEIMLLDEPLTYLDKKGRRLFSDLLERIRTDYGITILLVTHTEDDLSAQNWKRIMLDDGILEVQN